MNLKTLGSPQEKIILKTKVEIEYIRKSAKIIAELFKKLEELISPGISTKELDVFAEKFILSKGGQPAFKGYTIDKGFTKIVYPATLCTSVNEVIIHGIPSEKQVLKEGDIISIDVGVIYEGFYADAARTFKVGKVSPLKEKLMMVTRDALYKGIESAKPGNRIYNISKAIYEYVRSKGFDVLRDFSGHGVGKYLHEAPPIPNFPTNSKGPIIVPGMTLAIEPMVVSGSYKYKIGEDGWAVIMIDGMPSAHWEHTIAITDYGPEILDVL